MHNLRVIKWDRSVMETVEFDDYVAFQVHWAPFSPTQTYSYWQTGDLKRSLLIVCVVRETGLIRSVKLILAGRRVVRDASVRTLPSLEYIGAPVIDAGLLEDDGVRECPAPLDVRIGADAVRVSWSTEPPASVVATGSRVRLGLNEADELMMVEVNGILKEEMHQLLGAIELTTGSSPEGSA